jgi:hypothetical protein
MAAFPASSPTTAFKSPLRAFRAESCETVGSEEVYADAQARVAQWRKDVVNSASFEAQQGLRELCHEREQLNDLRADLASVQGLVEAASQLQAGGARLAEVVNSSTDAAATRAAGVARVRDELHELCETRKQELQQEELRILEQRAAADAQHAEALKLLGVYKDRLGMQITRVAPQTVRMAFCLIDQSDPQREFSFTLGLANFEEKAADAYSVQECIPDVPDLPKLLANLNADASSSTALPRFVCNIRRAFVNFAGVEAKPIRSTSTDTTSGASTQSDFCCEEITATTA